MANYIETASTKPILSRVSYVGEYAYDVFGYVGGYLNDLNISHKNNEIIVASGLIAVDGKRIVINDEMSITLPYESGGGMTEYNLFLKVNMATPDNLSLVTSVTYANPSDYRDDDLFLNYDNGIKFIKLATIVNSSAGIQGVEKVIPSVKEETEKYEPKIFIQGEYYMNGSQTVTFANNQKISDTKTGIYIVFSQYKDGNSVPAYWSYHFIPKFMLDVVGEGYGHEFSGTYNTSNDRWFKYIYISNDKIKGLDKNSQAPNNNIVLRYVIGV